MKRREVLTAMGGAAATLLTRSWMASAQAQTVKLGALFDITGPTGDVGTHYADGFRDYVRWVNEHGGIRSGVKVDLLFTDYQYKPDQAVVYVKKLAEQDQVPAISGWGTGDSILMKPQIEAFGVPYIPASFHSGLLDAPNDWIWLIGPSYTDHMKALLDYIKKTYKGIGHPRVGLAVNNSDYGRSPVGPAKEYAPKIGLEIVGVEEVPASAIDATSQLLNLKRFAPTHIINQNVARPSAIVIRDARKLGIDAQILGIHYIGDELLFDLVPGDAVDGVIASSFVSNWFENVPGMGQVQQINAAYHPDVKLRPLHYTQGIVHAMVWVEVFKRAQTLDRAGVAKVLSGLRMTTGGLTAPLAFGNDRKGSHAIKLLQADVKARRWKPIVGWYAPPA